jgi:tetratricopeptide (TPR) repeat protein
MSRLPPVSSVPRAEAAVPPPRRRLPWLLGALLLLALAFLLTGGWRQRLLAESARHRALVAELEGAREARSAQTAETASLEGDLSARPQDVELRLLVAERRWRLAGPAAAVEVLSAAPAPAAEPRVARMLAHCYRLTGREDRALEILDAAVAQSPGDGELRTDRALLYTLLAWHGEAEKELQAAERLGADNLYLARASLARAKGDPGAARSILEERLRVEPADPEAKRQLAAVNQQMSRYEEAVRLLESLDPAARTAEDRLNLAAAYVRRGGAPAAARALELLDRAAAGQPGPPRARFLRARCLLLLDREAEARGELEALRRDAPRFFGPAHELAELYRKDGRAAEAGKLLSEHRTAQERRSELGRLANGLMRDSKSAALHLDVGKLCLERGMYGRAAVELERAVELDPRLPGAAALLVRARSRATSAAASEE